MRTPFYQKITERILRDIRCGTLKPGERIPTVREIGEQYGVSAIVGLRVFKELSQSGLVIKRDGEGYFVRMPAQSPRGRNLVCLFRPLREEQEEDNFGNHVMIGIMNKSLECNMNLILPSSLPLLRNRTPSDQMIQQLASDVDPIPDKGGILLDQRITDSQIRRFLLPVSRGVPLVVVGRRSFVPGVKSSCMPFAVSGPQVAALAFRTGAKYFLNVLHSECSEQEKTLFGSLAKLGVSRENMIEMNNILLDKNLFEQSISRIITLIREIAPQRLFCYCDNDHASKAIFRELAASGIMAGRDYGLMGFGGMKMAFNNTPAIGTVVIPHYELGSNAVRLLQAEEEELFTAYSIQVNETL